MLCNKSSCSCTSAAGSEEAVKSEDESDFETKLKRKWKENKPGDKLKWYVIYLLCIELQIVRT